MELVFGKSRMDGLTRLIILVAAGFLLVALSPQDVTLGPIVKLVYAHLAIAWAALALFAFTGIFGALHLITGRSAFGEWAAGTQLAAIAFWLTYIPTSMFVAWLAWGGVNWSEPRLELAFRNAIIVVVAVVAARLAAGLKATSAVSVVLGVAVFELWSTRSNQLHPGNSVGASGSLEIKLFSLAILVVALIAAAQTAYILRPSMKRRDHEGLEAAAR